MLRLAGNPGNPTSLCRHILFVSADAATLDDCDREVIYDLRHILFVSADAATGHAPELQVDAGRPPHSLCQRGCCDDPATGSVPGEVFRHILFVSADAATLQVQYSSEVAEIRHILFVSADAATAGARDH